MKKCSLVVCVFIFSCVWFCLVSCAYAYRGWIGRKYATTEPFLFVCVFVGLCLCLFWIDGMWICNSCSLSFFFSFFVWMFAHSCSVLPPLLDKLDAAAVFFSVFFCLHACIVLFTPPLDRWNRWNPNMQQLYPHWISTHLCLEIESRAIWLDIQFWPFTSSATFNLVINMHFKEVTLLGQCFKCCQNG